MELVQTKYKEGCMFELFGLMMVVCARVSSTGGEASIDMVQG